MMSVLVSFLIQPDIENKIKHAPDKAYEIGVFIGTMLPFILLVILAYLVYRYNKIRNQ
ncbi:hypothetical protein [Aestuariibaculum sediminum]|uniref:Uncharacterized protein n=1 Tax=Aestuariibaculum sediminum TaxID=2770637 RepID=A0A8J6UEZ5_9FLAO|nr:hypothetical protein [Aestuariibaculum sediminum]MBD0831151.1 hypothetical protein [Aestuariibaculum sediminum]